MKISFYYGTRNPEKTTPRYWQLLTVTDLESAKFAAENMQGEYRPMPGENRVIGMCDCPAVPIWIVAELVDGEWQTVSLKRDI